MILTALVASVAMSQQALIPGATVWVWKLEGDLPRFPLVTANQTPNSYFICPGLDFEDKIESQEGDLKDTFVGEAHGFIDAPSAGTYQFHMEADDGGRLFIGETKVIDIERDAVQESRFTAEKSGVLKKGLNAFRFQFYENTGNFYARLKWKKPGDKEWSAIPTANLKTEAGQTFVVSPGVKTFQLASSPFDPGDRRPLDGVHPAYTLEDFRGEKFRPAVGGMCFLPDGRLAVCTWDPDGAVYLIDLNKKPVEVKEFARGLGEPLGIAWFDGHLLVTQKGEVTRLVDTNGDDVCDRYEVVAEGWPVSHNYHEFSFNLVPFMGKLYITSSVPLRGGWTNYTPGSTGAFPVSNGPGRWYEIDPKTGDWKALAHGLRTPNGMNIGVDGNMYCCDNQGSWMPSSRLNLMRPGAFYGHQESPELREEMDQPVVWYPQNEIGNSPSQPVLVSDGFYRGQMLTGDVTHGGIKRVYIDKVGGGYQGCVFRFAQGIEAGVNRMVWGPDGCLFVGGIGSNGNWNHDNTKFGLQRLRYNGKVPFEMYKVQSRKGGMLVTFTQPADPASLQSLDVQQWYYVQAENYGGDKMGLEHLKPKDLVWSKDKKSVFVALDGLKAKHLVYMRFTGLKSAAGAKMWSTEVWYTQNALSDVVYVDEPGAAISLSPKMPAGADVIISPTETALRPVRGGGAAWLLENGSVEADLTVGDMMSEKSYGDVYLHAEWNSPPGGDVGGQLGGNGGIKIQSQFELQVLNTPLQPVNGVEALANNGAGSIYSILAPSRNVSFGPGVWQTYDCWFRAAVWKDGKKVKNARMTVYWNGYLVHDDVEVPRSTSAGSKETPGPGPIVFQAHVTNADGIVRYRNAWAVADPWKKGILPPKP